MTTTIEHTIDGIPCLIGVTYFKQVKPWKGSVESCPSDLDFYGYTESDFIILDRKGYKADWLEKKLTGADIMDIKSKIAEEMCDEL